MMNDYKYSCRLCLKPHPDSIDIFSEEIKEELIPQKIFSILSILIHPEDCMPQKICPQCLENVKRLYKFCRTSSFSVTHLLSFLESDDDVAKNIYANLVKTFQKQNFRDVAGHTGYESWMVDKYEQVRAKVSEFTKQFIKPNEFSGTGKNYNMGIDFFSSQYRNSSIGTSPSDIEEPIQSRNENLKITAENGKSIETSSELFVHKTKKAGPLRTKKKKKIAPTIISLRANNISLNPTVENVKKVAAVKVYRCKYCEWANNNKDLVLSHEGTDHACSVQLNQYFGPSFINLRADFMNQIEKLSWPFRKKKYSRMTPTSKRNSKNRIRDFREIEENPAQLYSGIEKISGNEESEISKKTLGVSINNELGRTHSRKGHDTKKNDEPMICAETLSTQNNLDNIERPCNSPTPYSESTCCKFCSGYLKNVSPQEYLKHLNSEKCNTSQLSCTLCREDFSKKPDLLNNHIENCYRSMSLTKDVLCRKCNKFVKCSSFADHLITEHKALFKCFICSTSFNQKECLLHHLERCNFKPIIRTNFNCEVCKCVSTSLKSYKTHFITEHPSHYLNIDLSLNYRDNSEFENEKKVTDILPHYQIDRYLKSKSDGKYFCGLNNCKKVLNNILQLETHLQEHVLRKKKLKVIGKSSVNTEYSVSTMMSLYHDFKFKNKIYKSPAKEKEEADPKMSFVHFLGLKPKPKEVVPPLVPNDLNKISVDSSNDGPNIQFSAIPVKYMEDLGVDWPVQYTPNARNENEDPQIITISDSDDD